jgi:Ca-activated chloride channel family protein
MGDDAAESSARSWLTPAAFLLILAGILAFALLNLFGQTISSKFTKADSPVTNEVTFGHNSAGGAPPSNVKKAPAPASSKRGSSVRAHEVIADQSNPDEPPTQPPPNDSQPDQFTDYGVNHMTDASRDAKSTFAADVDTGSYTRARQRLLSGSGSLPHSDSVRVEEFVNYFDYDYRIPDERNFSVNVDGAPSPYAPQANRYLLRVGIQGKSIRPEQRKPAHLTFLVDTSGSMSGPDKLDRAKKALNILTNNLRSRDTIAITTFADESRTVLPPTSATDKDTIFDALADLRARGSTAMYAGLDSAYDLAQRQLDPDHINRVILVSDGGANVGPNTHDKLVDTIQSHVDKGITLTSVGFGARSARDTLLEQLANEADGHYVFVDSMSAARRVFKRQLTSTLQVIAEDLKLQVLFNDDFVDRYRLIGYENRNIQDKNFDNPDVDAGEIGAGHATTAFFEILLSNSANQDSIHQSDAKLATVRVRHTPPDGGEEQLRTSPVRGDSFSSSLTSTPHDFQFAAAVAGTAGKLRHSPYANHLSWKLLSDLATAGKWERTTRTQFIELLERATALTESSDH